MAGYPWVRTVLWSHLNSTLSEIIGHILRLFPLLSHSFLPGLSHHKYRIPNILLFILYSNLFNANLLFLLLNIILFIVQSFYPFGKLKTILNHWYFSISAFLVSFLALRLREICWSAKHKHTDVRHLLLQLIYCPI